MAKRTYPTKEITYEYLRSILRYDPETGLFTWLVANTNSIKVGDIAGCVHKKNGYRLIWVGGKLRKASRLAFVYMTGHWPLGIAEHENRNKSDDRWMNLRDADQSQNCANIIQHRDNKTRLKGVTFHPGTGKYRSEICVRRKKRHLGLFQTPEEAHAAYCAAALEANGEFANPGT